MGIFEKIRAIFASPSNFFKKVEKEEGIKNAFLYLLALGIFNVVLSLIVVLVFRMDYLDDIFQYFPSLSISFAVFLLGVFLYALHILLSFVASFLLFIWLRIFRGKKGYSRAYRLHVYANTPNFLFSWIPVIGFFAFIYYLVFLIIGTREVYGFSSLKSTLIYVIPLAILLLVLLVLFVLAFVTLFSLVDVTNVGGF